jgi:uncharacterized membrane protein
MRSINTFALVAPVALVLAACQPQASGGAASPPTKAPAAQGPATSAPAAASGPTFGPGPAETVMDLSKPLMARGTEPFWAVRMNGTTLTLMRPGEPEKVFTSGGAQMTPGKATVAATAGDGQTLTLTLYDAACNDGMSDVRYPMSAEVATPGLSLNGCAAKVSDLPREGGG